MPIGSAFASIGKISTAIGGIASAVGTFQKGKEAKQTEFYNASINEAQASAVRTKTQMDLERMKSSTESLFSAQQAIYAKAGVTFRGSPLEVMAHSLYNANLDQAIAKYNSEVQIQGLEAEARLERIAGRAAYSQGIMRSGTTLLKTAYELSKL